MLTPAMLCGGLSLSGTPGRMPYLAWPVPRQHGDFEVSAAFAAQGLGDRVEGERGSVVGGGEVGEPDGARAAITGQLGDEPRGLGIRQVAVRAGHAPLEGV